MSDPVTLVVPVQNARKNEYLGHPYPDDYFVKFGPSSDVWADASEGSGTRFRFDQFGTEASIVGTGVIGDFEPPIFDDVSAARLRVSVRCIDGDDRPAVPIQSLYYHISNNAYGSQGAVPEWRIEGWFNIGPTGTLANVDLDLFDAGASSIYTAVANSLPASPTPEFMADFWAHLGERPGLPTIDFATGGYGTMIHEIYEVSFQVTGTQEEPVDDLYTAASGLAGPTRTRFYPA